MHITRKDRIKVPVAVHTGERIYEMIGRSATLGESAKHSVGHVVIPPGCSSRPHFHPEAEETFYILSGAARIRIDGNEFRLRPGDAVLIRPLEQHQVFTEGPEDLEFLVICVPAWEPTNSVFLDEDKSPDS